MNEPINQSINPSIHPSIHPFIHPSIHPSINRSINRAVHCLNAKLSLTFQRWFAVQLSACHCGLCNCCVFCFGAPLLKVPWLATYSTQFTELTDLLRLWGLQYSESQGEHTQYLVGPVFVGGKGCHLVSGCQWPITVSWRLSIEVVETCGT